MLGLIVIGFTGFVRQIVSLIIWLQKQQINWQYVTQYILLNWPKNNISAAGAL